MKINFDIAEHFYLGDEFSWISSLLITLIGTFLGFLLVLILDKLVDRRNQKRKEIEEDTFQSYLFTLVRNACLNHIKHQQIVDSHLVNLDDTTKEEGLYYADFFSDPFHQTIFNEIQSQIEKIIQELPEQTQNVFRLSRFEGLKNSEIAEKLEVTVRTVEKHNTRALEKIRTNLSAHYLCAIVVLDLIKEFNS